MTEPSTHGSTTGTTTCLELFRIQPEIPLQHAFDELSVLLGCIRHLTREAEMEGDLIAGGTARILSAMAKALIDDMENGLIAGQARSHDADIVGAGLPRERPRRRALDSTGEVVGHRHAKRLLHQLICQLAR